MIKGADVLRAGVGLGVKLPMKYGNKKRKQYDTKDTFGGSGNGCRAVRCL